MKKYIIPILPLVVFLFSFSNVNECKKFKKGIFELDSFDGSTHIITRTKNKQIEKVGKTGVVSEFDIKWLSDCSYILFNRKLISGIDEYPEMNSDTIYNEIVGIEGNTIKVLTTLKRYDFKAEATLRKIK